MKTYVGELRLVAQRLGSDYALQAARWPRDRAAHAARLRQHLRRARRLRRLAKGCASPYFYHAGIKPVATYGWETQPTPPRALAALCSQAIAFSGLAHVGIRAVVLVVGRRLPAAVALGTGVLVPPLTNPALRRPHLPRADPSLATSPVRTRKTAPSSGSKSLRTAKRLCSGPSNAVIKGFKEHRQGSGCPFSGLRRGSCSGSSAHAGLNPHAAPRRGSIGQATGTSIPLPRTGALRPVKRLTCYASPFGKLASPRSLAEPSRQQHPCRMGLTTSVRRPTHGLAPGKPGPPSPIALTCGLGPWGAVFVLNVPTPGDPAR
jgi:hypothetical protein